MAQGFLHHRQHIPLMRRGHMQHPLGGQSGTGQARREQVGGRSAPKHWAIQPGQDAGHEQRRAGALNFVRAATGYFMQCTQLQPGLGQMRIQRGHAERQYAAGARSGPFQKTDAAAKGGDGGGHVP